MHKPESQFIYSYILENMIIALAALLSCVLSLLLENEYIIKH